MTICRTLKNVFFFIAFKTNITQANSQLFEHVINILVYALDLYM